MTEHDATSDLWRHTLSQIPSTFGRLVYLASLRDPNTGRYEHYGLAHLFGEIAADQAIRQSHEQNFFGWLNYSLEQQNADLDVYLRGLEGDRRKILETWGRLAPYRNLIPAGATERERRLYLSDVETLLELLTNEFGVAAPDPDS